MVLPKAALVLLLTAWLAASSHAGAAKDPRSKPIVHVVYAGQTLGKIAKRYNVSIEELCAANGISRRSPIAPGQRLTIPPPPGRREPAKDTTDKAAHGERTTKTDAAQSLATKSAAAKSEPQKPEQPTAKSAQVATVARTTKASAPSTPPRSQRSWKEYRRPARKKGYVSLKGTAGSWNGYVILKGGRVAPEARLGFKRVFASWRTGKQLDIPERLIRLIVRISDTFGGNQIRIVGGVREHSYARASHHRNGEAVDFSVQNVPNDALVDYLRAQENTGVGYYPHSSFVHLDVRNHKSYWVDYSRPGQRPIYAREQRRAALAPSVSKSLQDAETPEPEAPNAAETEAVELANAPDLKKQPEQTPR